MDSFEYIPVSCHVCAPSVDWTQRFWCKTWCLFISFPPRNKTGFAENDQMFFVVPPLCVCPRLRPTMTWVPHLAHSSFFINSFSTEFKEIILSLSHKIAVVLHFSQCFKSFSEKDFDISFSIKGSKHVCISHNTYFPPLRWVITSSICSCCSPLTHSTTHLGQKRLHITALQ